MSPIQILRSLVTERLSAAAEEIFVLFERTIIEYEGEIDRQRKLLHVLTPEMRTDTFLPQLLICEEEDRPEQQERSPSLDHEEPEPPHIKEEQEESCSSQEGEQLQSLDEEEIKWASCPLPVKREHEEDKPQCSWFNQNQLEDSREAEPLPRTSAEQTETQPGGDNWTAPEPDRKSCPSVGSDLTRDCLFPVDSSAPDIVDVGVWGKTQQPHSGYQALRSHPRQIRGRVRGQTSSPSNSLNRSMEASHQLQPSNQIPHTACCKVCRAYFPNTMSLNRHVKIHSSDCGLCGRHLQPTESLKIHLEAHRICTICGKSFTKHVDIATHVRSHVLEQPFVCGDCGKTFKWKVHLQAHMRSHTGEKPFSCSVCGKAFSMKHGLKTHMRTHTGEKPFRCPICGRSFCVTSNLKTHMRTHSNEKPFNCSVCGKGFSQSGNFKKHMRTH